MKPAKHFQRGLFGYLLWLVSQWFGESQDDNGRFEA